MITKLTVRNYKCLADVTLEPGDFTVLVGPNSSGKSTLLDVLEFTKDALTDSLPTALDRRGGIQLLRRRSGGHPTNVSVEMEFRNRENTVHGCYGFTIKAEQNYAYSVQEESCQVTVSGNLTGGRQEVRFGRDRGRLSTSFEGINVKLDDRRLALPVIAAHPLLAHAHDILTSVAVYSIQPDKLREAQEPTEGQVLRKDGSNAASVLRELMSSRRDVYDRVSEMLSHVSPGVSAPGTGHRGRQLALTFKVDVGAPSKWEFESFLMSDGTLRLLGILLALEQRRNLEVLGVEEPEATIHPGALAILMDALKAATSHAQVIITTHSPDILDQVDIGSIHCVGLVRGQTRISPPSFAARDTAKQSLMSPGELMRANALEPDETELEAVASSPPALFGADWQ